MSLPTTATIGAETGKPAQPVYLANESFESLEGEPAAGAPGTVVRLSAEDATRLDTVIVLLTHQNELLTILVNNIGG